MRRWIKGKDGICCYNFPSFSPNWQKSCFFMAVMCGRRCRRVQCFKFLKWFKMTFLSCWSILLFTVLLARSIFPPFILKQWLDSGAIAATQGLPLHLLLGCGDTQHLPNASEEQKDGWSLVQLPILGLFVTIFFSHISEGSFFFFLLKFSDNENSSWWRFWCLYGKKKPHKEGGSVTLTHQLIFFSYFSNLFWSCLS